MGEIVILSIFGIIMLLLGLYILINIFNDFKNTRIMAKILGIALGIVLLIFSTTIFFNAFNKYIYLMNM